MKRTMLCVVVMGAAMLLSGCAGMVAYNGLPSPFPGSIFTRMQVGALVQPKQVKDYEVIKYNATAEGQAVSVFMIVATGDISYDTLKRRALATAPGADDLINIEVDFRQNNILGINEVTVVLTGTAIKYKK